MNPERPGRPSRLLPLLKGSQDQATTATAAGSSTTAVSTPRIHRQRDDRVEISSPRSAASAFDSVRRIRPETGSIFDDASSVRSFSRPDSDILSAHHHGPSTVELGIFDNACEQHLSSYQSGVANDDWHRCEKQFLILSLAGKPIYVYPKTSGSISATIGVIHTIIAAQGTDHLRSFAAGHSKFLVVNESPVLLVAISRLCESDAQLASQLDALYMQILSTLTLPNLQHIFSNRPSSDLQAPLRGTEGLLDAIARKLSRGSISCLLSAVECLYLRAAVRTTINRILLDHRCPELLYGLLMAGDRLVSVLRPRKHTLHPGDLQLLSNLLLESSGLRTGGGENWLPICLPGFNKTGYLHLYVSFFGDDQAVSLLLISADKSSFHEMRSMRDRVFENLQGCGCLTAIQSAMNTARPRPPEPHNHHHFLYKSRENVQYITTEWHTDGFPIYTRLHGMMRTKTPNLKMFTTVVHGATCLAWMTDSFEIYCFADSSVSPGTVAAEANSLVQWVRQRESDLFIIGGAVF